MKSSIITSISIFSFLFSFSCTKQAEKDPRIDKLQDEVQTLSEKNKEFESEIQQLRRDLNELKNQQQSAQKPQTPQQQQQKMTVDVMKREIRPALDEAIRDIKKKTETPRKGSQFGMRVEYDFQKAFYGLIDTGDESVPYKAKIIIQFEKFLESEKESKSYGKGSTTLMFSYRKRKWALDSAE
ncbi:MAG TPA: hypothetical protein VLH08_09350 [Acidobacteriota bacterium]|nr:hypothetical protein [Acidobacteriota bacterium]